MTVKFDMIETVAKHQLADLDLGDATYSLTHSLAHFPQKSDLSPSIFTQIDDLGSAQILDILLFSKDPSTFSSEPPAITCFFATFPFCVLKIS